MTRPDEPTRQSRTLLAAVLTLATLAASGAPSPRTVSESRTIPSNVWMVFSVPDVPAAWKALTATPVYQDAVALLDNPVIANLPVYRQFLEEKRQMETELGFPITAATLAEMIAGFDYVSMPPFERGGPPLSVCTFRAADAPRFRRLIDYIELQMDTAPGSRTTATTKSDLVREQYKNVEIVSSSGGTGFAVAQLGPAYFAMGNRPQAIRVLIDQGQKGEGLTAHERFRSAVGGLVESAPHGFLYLNSSQAAPLLGRGGLPGLPFSTLVRDLRDEVAMAADFRIESNAIRFESFLPFADVARDRLAAIYRHYPPAPLRSFDYISSSPLVFMARNTFDGPALYESMRAMVLASIRAVIEPGQNPEQRLRLKEENFREQLGFGLRDDLAPAIGPEAFVSLERMSFDPFLPLPTLELVTGIQVRDAQRMERVIAGFEGFFGRQLGGLTGDTEPSAVLQAAAYQGKMIKWFAVPHMPQYAIGYTRTDSFVLVGLGGNSIKCALDRADGRQKSFAAGRLYTTLQPFLHKETNEVFVLNVSEMTAIGREFARRLPKNAPNQTDDSKRLDAVMTRMGRITALGASTAGSEAGLHTRGALVFRPSEAKKRK